MLFYWQHFLFFFQVVALDGRVRQESAGSRHLLLIHRAETSDLGKFMCYATNELGSAQRTLDMTHDDLSVAEGEDFVGSDDADQDAAEMSDDILDKIEGTAEALESFKQEVGVELRALKNLTAARSGEANGGTSVDLSIFADLERIQLELSRLREDYGKEIPQLLAFKRTSGDELQRLWDNVNELQVGQVYTASVVYTYGEG